MKAAYSGNAPHPLKAKHKDTVVHEVLTCGVVMSVSGFRFICTFAYTVSGLSTAEWTPADMMKRPCQREAERYYIQYYGTVCRLVTSVPTYLHHAHKYKRFGSALQCTNHSCGPLF